MSSFPIVFHPLYEVQVKSESRFPAGKYGQLKSFLESESILTKSNLFVPQPLSPSIISLAHSGSYVKRVKNFSLSEKEIREIGLGNINTFCQRAFFSAGGTLLAAKLALEFGLAANAAGGSHHASWLGGSGFCIFNDVAVAVSFLLKVGIIKNALILDLDVHQGDGTASIFEFDERVFTVSVHCQKNFPARKAKSNLDLGLETGIDDNYYLSRLDDILIEVSKVPADLILYNAGVDIHRNDSLGHLGVSSYGIMLREKRVVDFALKRGVPLVVTLGGGYQKSIANLVRLHSMVFKAMLNGRIYKK